MAKKVILKDLNNVEILPITRGELILDSSGKEAFHSNDFLATTSLPGLMSPEEKSKLASMAGNTIDTALSTTSINPVLNKVVTVAINEAKQLANDALETANDASENVSKVLQIINSIKESYLKSATVNGNTLTIVDLSDSETKFNNTTYTFTNGTDGSFSVTPSGGSAQKVTVGKTATAGTADKVSNKLILKVKSGTTEGTDIYTYDGSAAKTLDIKAGNNITLTPTAGVLTISATNSNTTYTLSGALDGNTFVTTLTPSSGTATTAVIPAMVGASSSAAGKAGLVPAPAVNKHTSFLKGDGSWAVPTDTKNTAGSTNSTSKLFLIGATSQAANPQTYSNSAVYTTNGTLYASTFVGNLDGTYVNKLTNYTKATAIGSIAATDSLNTALGKLEFKTDFIYNDLFGTDNDDVINKWHEIVDFVDSVAEGTDILDEFVTRKTAQTITGLKTFLSNSSTTGISLILKNSGWTGNMSTAMDFYNGSAYKVPNARIETKMVGDGKAGGTLIFYTLTKHASTNPNPNGLTERLRIDDNGVTKVTGALTVTGDCDFSGGTIKFDTINIPTTSGGTTYGVGSSGQVLKSNGTTVYWASDNNSDTWRPVMVNGTSVATSATGTGTLNIVQGTGITVSGAVNSLTITNAGVRSVTIGTSTNADKLAVNTNGTTNYLTIPYATKANQDIDGNDFKTTYLRKVSVANNTTNDFNTFENMTLTGRGDPKTGASLSNAPWSGYGPAGGYGVLTYLWSGYGTQMAWGYGSNRIYIRNKYYSGSATTWSSTWDSLALTSDIPTVTNYYWADLKISSSSNTATSPTVALLKATTGVQIGSTADYGWYLNSSRICAGSTTARGVNVGSLLVSSAWADNTKVPVNGIYSKGNIQTAGGLIVGTTIFLNTGDPTLKVYSGRITDAKSDGNICFLTSIDGTDGESHTYPTSYGARCNIVLQPRGGQVYIGTNPDGGNTAYKLYVNGGIFSTGFVKASSSDSYVLLGGGGHKALSDFAMSSDYVKKAGDTMTGNLTMSTGAAIHLWDDSATASHRLSLRCASDVGRIYNYTGSAYGAMYIGHDGTNAIVITSGLNVGIGTGTPSDKLDVVGNIRAIRGTKYIQIRQENDTWSSFYTNATLYYFDKPIEVNGNHSPYTNNSFSSGTSSKRWSNVYSVLGNFTGNVTLYSASGDSPHLYFLRGTTTDGTYDWDMFVTDGSLTLRQNNAGTWNTALTAADNYMSTGWRFNVGKELSVKDQRFNYSLAYYNTNTSTVTGTIVITLPNGWTNAMNTYEIDIYEYIGYSETTDNVLHSKLIIDGYNYSGSSAWINYGYTQIGSYNKGVRLGYNGSKCVIMLGTTSTTWTYPQVHLSRVITGYANQTAWSTGYSISVITSESGYSAIVTANRLRQRFADVVANTFRGTLSGRATSVGDGGMIMYPQFSNEINFGGTNNSGSIYFGYRATDSRPIPSNFIFGGNGSATLTATKLHGIGVLTLNGVSGIYLKYNDTEASSIVLSSAYFKPFDAANNKLSLGTSAARWSNVYSYLGNFAGTVSINCAWPNIVCNNNASGATESNIRFEVGGANKGYVGFTNTYGTYLYNSSAGKYVYINNSGYFYTQSYINVGAGNEKNASNPPYVWGVNGSDNFMRTYATSSLSVGKAANADYATSAPAAANYGGTGSTTKIKIKINSTTSWMLSFVVTIYQGYKSSKIMVSGYNYGTNYWYEPEAVLLGDSNGATSIPVYFGYDSALNLWVGFDGGSYTGVSISDVTNGYTQISSLKGLFTISNVSSLTTIQKTVTATNSVNYAVSAGTSSNVVVNSSDYDSTYRMVWHSGNSLYSTAGIYCNPSSDYLYSTSMVASSWFRSTGKTGWYSSDYGGGIYMEDTSWVRTYGGKNFYCSAVIQAGNRFYTGYDSGVTNSVSCSNWFRSNGNTGWYNPTNECHVYPNAVTTYGGLILRGEKGGYHGALLGTGTSHMNLMSSTSHHGLYCEAKGRWEIYYSVGSDAVGIRTSTITKNFNVSGTSYLSSNTWIGTTSGSEMLNVGGWVGTVGTTGWYNSTYTGGIYMEDSTWVRIYNNKKFYVSNSEASAIHSAGGVYVAGCVHAYANYLKSTCNGKTITIGSLNASWCHYSTDAPAHWFNTSVYVQGNVYGGSSYNRRLAYVDELPTNTWRPITNTYTGSDLSTSVSLYGTNAMYNALVNGASDRPVVLLAGTLYRSGAGAITTWSFTGIRHRSVSSTNPTIYVSGGVARFYFTANSGYGFSIYAVNVNHQASGEATGYTATEYKTRSSGLYWFGAYASGLYIYIRSISQGDLNNDTAISYAGLWNSYDDGVTRMQIIAVGYAW